MEKPNINLFCILTIIIGEIIQKKMKHYKKNLFRLDMTLLNVIQIDCGLFKSDNNYAVKIFGRQI